jgi:hypothetical protein
MVLTLGKMTAYRVKNLFRIRQKTMVKTLSDNVLINKEIIYD